jgi:Lipid A disaccharide synthetase
LDHILLLFNFEKKYFDKENIKNTFVGHPLLDKKISGKIDISNLISNDKKIISIFPGSRISEITTLMPILIDFINLMNKEYEDLKFIFHVNEIHKKIVLDYLKKSNLSNIDVISDEKLKNEILSRSFFAVSKSGTVSLEICNHGVPSIILYKLSPLNFFLIKSLVKIKFVNIINIINNKEIIPELLQSECNPKEIFKSVNYFFKKPEMISAQLKQVNKTIDEIKSKNPSADNAAKILFESFTI